MDKSDRIAGESGLTDDEEAELFGARQQFASRLLGANAWPLVDREVIGAEVAFVLIGLAICFDLLVLLPLEAPFTLIERTGGLVVVIGLLLEIRGDEHLRKAIELAADTANVLRPADLREIAASRPFAPAVDLVIAKRGVSYKVPFLGPPSVITLDPVLSAWRSAMAADRVLQQIGSRWGGRVEIEGKPITADALRGVPALLRNIQWVRHTLVISGTLVWSFGDLVIAFA